MSGVGCGVGGAPLWVGGASGDGLGMGGCDVGGASAPAQGCKSQ